MTRFRSQPLACWGNHPVQQCDVARPERLRELREAVGSGSVSSVLSRGLGRSYGDAALNGGGGVILHERLDRLLDFDEETGVLECEGGASLDGIVAALLPRGFFPAVTPGTRFVTVGGAIAADVHGKNHHVDGSFASCVERFELLTPGGDVLTCSRGSNEEEFFATLGGMGLTGLIVSARVRLRRVESAWVRVEEKRCADLDETIEQVSGAFSERAYAVAWIDCLAGGGSLGRSVVMGGEHAGVDAVPGSRRGAPLEAPRRRARGVPVFLPSGVLNPLTVRVFNSLYYRAHPSRERVVDVQSFFYPLDNVLDWNRVYGRRGFQQYQAVIPHEGARGGLVELLEKLSSSRRASFLAVLKTMGPESGGLLSFPMPGWTLALDLPMGPGLDEFLGELDRVVMGLGGRRYLAKDASMRGEDFRAMYPRWERFMEVRRRLDPGGRLSSSLARRLGLAEA